jgi:hypothetical protein
MRGVYTAQISFSLDTARTLLYVQAPSGKVVEVLSAAVTQSGGSSQLLACALQRISSLGTPQATAVTASPHESGDQSAGSTIEGNVTDSEPTYGGDRFNLRGFVSVAGWFFDPVRDGQVFVAPGGALGLRSLANATSALDVRVELAFREIG